MTAIITPSAAARSGRRMVPKIGEDRTAEDPGFRAEPTK